MDGRPFSGRGRLRAMTASLYAAAQRRAIQEPADSREENARSCPLSARFRDAGVSRPSGPSMNQSISAPFIRYPIGTSLLMAGVLFVGLVAYPLLPVAPLPQVDFPTIQVSASLPGGSPETMASSVAQPLERQFAQIPGIAQMTSTSSLGSTSVTIQFDLDRQIDAAANDVQAAINAASGQLPKNLPSPPTYRKVNPADSPILLLSATS